ncbi:MAG: hypothetical protein IJW49_06380 [Clostridia bacterium]|nr:hypothetical protein [Clostridia bacterium]
MKKFWKILLIVLAALLSLLIVAWAGLMVAKLICYPDYVSEKETVCTIPAIHDGFVPQGVAHISDTTYIFSGYDGDALEIHLSKNGTPIEIIPVDGEGRVWESHGGGVAVVKDLVYVTGTNSLLIFDLNDIMSAEDGAKVANIDKFIIDVTPSYCFATDEMLYVGEFYDGEKYKTDQTHHVTTASGEKHYALTAAYSLNEEGRPLSNTPDLYISTRNKVQGFAVSGNTYILSSSYGLASSELDFYGGLTGSGTTIEIEDKIVPLYHLESSTHIKTVSMPAMSEGLDVVGNRVVISFESACNKYIFGKIFFADKLVSYPVS